MATTTVLPSSLVPSASTTRQAQLGGAFRDSSFVRCGFCRWDPIRLNLSRQSVTVRAVAKRSPKRLKYSGAGSRKVRWTFLFSLTFCKFRELGQAVCRIFV